MSTAVAVIEGPGTALATPAPRVGLLRPIGTPQEVIAAQEETRALVTQALQKERDYGVIPGTNKPTLYKAGAERVALGFGCYFGEAEIIEREIDHDREVQYVAKGKPSVSYGLYRYVVRVPVIHRETGAVVGTGLGVCSTMESKYVSRPRDCENTALKMAHKRALVGAALITFGLSDQFTQDVEDMPREMFDRGAAEQGGGAETTQVSGAAEPEARCPKCAGKMWDNRGTPEKPKTNPKAPDFKCRDKDKCDGVYWPGQWPPKPAEQKTERPRGSIPFPKSFPIPTLRGKTVNDATYAELEQALAASRERNAEKWVDLLSEELEDRRARGDVPQAELPLPEPVRTPTAAQVNMPPGGPIAPALEPQRSDERPVALLDDDDDLPF